MRLDERHLQTVRIVEWQDAIAKARLNRLDACAAAREPRRPELEAACRDFEACFHGAPRCPRAAGPCAPTGKNVRSVPGRPSASA